MGSKTNENIIDENNAGGTNAMYVDRKIITFEQCHRCGKRGSHPDALIRACTRCYSVGYCSKNCQRQDWATSGRNGSGGRIGHKWQCPPIVPNEKDAGVNGRKSNGAVGTKPSGPPMGASAASSETKKPLGSRASDESETNEGEISPERIDSILRSLDDGKKDGAPPDKSRQSKQSRAKILPRLARNLLDPSGHSNHPRESLSPPLHYAYRHSADGADENLLILLHGAGDTHVPFHELGQCMALPQTAVLSVSASSCRDARGGSGGGYERADGPFVELPFELGWTWFDEMDYERTGEPLPGDHPRRVRSLDRATSAIERVLCALVGIDREENVVDSDRNGEVNGDDHWAPERVFLLGFSAGACLTMELCRSWRDKGRQPLGGAICIAGGIKNDINREAVDPSSAPPPARDVDLGKNRATDVLILTGENDPKFPPDTARRSARLYCLNSPSCVRVHIQKGKGHDMIRSKDEMRGVMEFLSKRLVRRMAAMKGWTEVSTDNTFEVK